ncbi:acetyl-CoA acetyltransferase [Qipengyuania sphaerica]|uniref:acetyl-CoA acetyltransferase n=1 Tax=Qipengyuania sphaerica TaxID=2867243 RepID=UPI001C8A54AA|nr:acetyl-CoA acetyltransferase [Qipengyuania sphaerica]MBX7541822.1 acetyl-CoA acetyltransferase [Qipengyuania sphaerica]
MSEIDPRKIPVIIGVGQVNDRPEDPLEGHTPVDLMAEALRRADADAGGGMLQDCDWLAVVRQIAFPEQAEANQLLEAALGIAPRTSQTSPSANGNTPTRLLSDAANAIGSGAATICAVVGAEALRTAGARKAQRQIADTASSQAGNPSSVPRKYDPLRDAAHRIKTGFAPSYGLVAPTDVYPLFENALRAKLGQSLDESQAESGLIWSLMSKVAAGNENAWLRSPLEAAEIIEPSPRNRPVAFPYTKFQVANAAVNQGAGFIVTSLAEARKRGVPEDRLVHVGYGAAAAEAYDVLVRERYDASPSMIASIEGAMEANGIGVEDLDHVELYSCFPCIPKMARRIVGWPADRPASLVGGLTFGGGPVGNYMSHAIAQATEALRGTGDKALLFGNGGAYATHNHTIMLSGRPTGAIFPHDYSRQAEADEMRGEIPDIDEQYSGPATVETYTVFFERDGSPRSGVIVARTPAGTRTLSYVPGDDSKAIAFLTDGTAQPVGSHGVIVRKPDGLGHWQRAS